MQVKFGLAHEAMDFDNAPDYQKAFGNPNKWFLKKICKNLIKSWIYII